jgi:hypothetical protein
MLYKTRREAAYWRELLKRVARDMERSARAETDPQRQRWFVSRARRVRECLVRGVPDDWTEDSDDAWHGGRSPAEHASGTVDRQPGPRRPPRHP